MTLPPIEELRSLFHYNAITGAITYLADRGPRKAGDPAGGTQGSIPHVYAAGKQRRAAAVAWALHYGYDPSPQHVICADGNPANLALSNLALSPEPRRYSSPRGKPARKPGWHTKDIRRHKRTGLWVAKYNGQRIGEFGTRPEAIAARRLAGREEGQDDG